MNVKVNTGLPSVVLADIAESQMVLEKATALQILSENTWSPILIK